MLNDAQNRKLIGKLKRALEVFEPYVFTKIAQLPYTMYETADRLETVPDATLAAVPETRPTGKTWGGEGWAAALPVPGAWRVRGHVVGERRTLWYLCHQNCRNPPWQPLLRLLYPRCRSGHPGAASH